MTPFSGRGYHLGAVPALLVERRAQHDTAATTPSITTAQHSNLQSGFSSGVVLSLIPHQRVLAGIHCADRCHASCTPARLLLYMSILQEDFFNDLEKEVNAWSKKRAESGKQPASLWEELSAIGEEFVDFLEAGLADEYKCSKGKEGSSSGSSTEFNHSSRARSPMDKYEELKRQYDLYDENLKKSSSSNGRWVRSSLLDSVCCITALQYTSGAECRT